MGHSAGVDIIKHREQLDQQQRQAEQKFNSGKTK